MKTILLFILLHIANLSFAQTEIKHHNIFLQEFNYSSVDCYSENNNLIFFNKYYSDEKLKLGSFDYNDSLFARSLEDKKRKYEYYIRREYSKDTIIGIYEPKDYSLFSALKIKSEKKIKFSNFPENLITYECDDNLYENVVIQKSFFMTSCVIIKDEINKKYKLQLIAENCEVVHEETFELDLQYSENKNFLALKYRGSFIFVFDKYTF